MTLAAATGHPDAGLGAQEKGPGRPESTKPPTVPITNNLSGSSSPQRKTRFEHPSRPFTPKYDGE